MLFRSRTQYAIQRPSGEHRVLRPLRSRIGRAVELVELPQVELRPVVLIDCREHQQASVRRERECRSYRSAGEIRQRPRSPERLSRADVDGCARDVMRVRRLSTCRSGPDREQHDADTCRGEQSDVRRPAHAPSRRR